MAAPDRLIPNSLTPGEVPGDEFMDAVQDELTGLWNTSSILLGSIAGTANAITGTIAPALTDDLVAGMRFSFIAIADNTGATTLNDVDVVDLDGDALTGGEIVSGRLHQVEFDGESFRLLGGGASSGGGIDYQVFTGSGTWTKPAGAPANARVHMEGEGGGGGGGSGTTYPSGGGGGGYSEVGHRLGDLPSTLDMTVPAAAAVGTAGGNASADYDSVNYFVAYGGGAGQNNVSQANGGGGGGGELAKGTTDADPGTGGEGGAIGGGRGGPDESTTNGWLPTTLWGGGGGGAGINSFPGGNGGDAIRGGAGGGGKGSTSGAGGTSRYGGNGGAYGVAGSPRGGGGGGNAAGGRGEIRIWVIW